MLIDDRSRMFVGLFGIMVIQGMVHAQHFEKDFTVFAGRKPYVHKKSKMLNVIPQPVVPSPKELEWEKITLRAQRRSDEEQYGLYDESPAMTVCPYLEDEDEPVLTRRGLATFGLHIADDKNELQAVQNVLIKKLATFGIDSRRFEKFKNFHSSILYTNTDDSCKIEVWKRRVSRAIESFMHQHRELPVYPPVVLVSGPVFLCGSLEPGKKIFFGVDLTPGDYVEDLFDCLSFIDEIKDAHHVSIGCLKANNWQEVDMLKQEFNRLKGPVCVPFDCPVDKFTLFPTKSCDREDYCFVSFHSEEPMAEIE